MSRADDFARVPFFSERVLEIPRIPALSFLAVTCGKCKVAGQGDRRARRDQLGLNRERKELCKIWYHVKVVNEGSEDT